MQRLTHEQLAQAHDRQDWDTLWLAARPLVKLAIRRMMQRGEVDPSLVDGELLQTGTLAVGECLRAWVPWEATFATWIMLRVRGAMLDYLYESRNGGVGSRRKHTPHHSLQESQNSGDEGNPGAEEEADTRQDFLVYSEGAGTAPPDSHSDIVRLREAIARLPQSERRVLEMHLEDRSLAEIGATFGRSNYWAHGQLESAKKRITKRLESSIPTPRRRRDERGEDSGNRDCNETD